MENFDNVLMIMILVIFGLTAVISLGSIPDWIKIPEWYKKKLYVNILQLRINPEFDLKKIQKAGSIL
jgi:hypothetical protein